MKTVLIELRDALSHLNTYVIGIGVGLVAKISYDLYMKRTLSFVQWCAVVSLSVFCGYITGMWCIESGRTDLSQVIVPLATLFGEKVVVYIMENYKTILGGIVAIFRKK